MIFYSLYGTKGFVETGREGGWGGTTGRYFYEDEMTKEEGSQTIDCPTVDPNAPDEAQAGRPRDVGVLHDPRLRRRDRERTPAADRRRRGPSTSRFPGICAHESAMARRHLDRRAAVQPVGIQVQ